MGEFQWNVRPDSTILRIYCLGSFKVVLPGAPEPLGEGSSHKSWALLKYMAVYKGSPIPTERIMDTFWPNRKNLNDTAALRTALCRLKTMLQPVKSSLRNPSMILFRKDTCRLNTSAPVWIDSAEFEKQCALAHRVGQKDRKAGIQFYLDTLELYQGDFLAEDLYQEWTTLPREYYRRLFVESTGEAAGWLIEMQNYHQARQIIEKGLERDSLVEELHYLLLQTLEKQNEIKAALKHYLYCTHLLANELGVKPSEKMKKIYRILREKHIPHIEHFDLKDELGKQSQYTGPMVCEPDIFWNFVLFTRRQMSRNGGESTLVILEVLATEDQDRKLKFKIVEKLENVARRCLRKSDLICRLGERQLALLLPGTSCHGSNAAVDHIKNSFFQMVPPTHATLQAKIKEIPAVGRENEAYSIPSN